MRSKLKDYVDEIENQIDLRYESIVGFLETYRLKVNQSYSRSKRIMKSKFSFSFGLNHPQFHNY